MLVNLGSIFGGHGESKHNVDQKVDFNPNVATGAQFMMMGNVNGGDVNQAGDSKAEGAGFNFNFDFGDMGSFGKKPEAGLMLMNLGSIFGGHGESKHNVDQKVNFNPNVAEGSQFMMMGNVNAGNVDQNGGAEAGGAGFNFNFDFGNMGSFGKKEEAAAELMNLGSIFGGHGESKHDVKQDIKFNPEVATGAQFMMMGNVNGGNVNQGGNAEAGGTQFGFNFDFNSNRAKKAEPEAEAEELMILLI